MSDAAAVDAVFSEHPAIGPCFGEDYVDPSTLPPRDISQDDGVTDPPEW
jgi:hypothetical protein